MHWVIPFQHFLFCIESFCTAKHHNGKAKDNMIELGLKA